MVCKSPAKSNPYIQQIVERSQLQPVHIPKQQQQQHRNWSVDHFVQLVSLDFSEMFSSICDSKIFPSYFTAPNAHCNAISDFLIQSIQSCIVAAYTLRNFVYLLSYVTLGSLLSVCFCYVS